MKRVFCKFYFFGEEKLGDRGFNFPSWKKKEKSLNNSLIKF